MEFIALNCLCKDTNQKDQSEVVKILFLIDPCIDLPLKFSLLSIVFVVWLTGERRYNTQAGFEPAQNLSSALVQP